jgi:CCR4-NOT transcription complex subunit 3
MWCSSAGMYVFFDYESAWCRRIKKDFVFEYAYLEDELAV